MTISGTPLTSKMTHRNLFGFSKYAIFGNKVKIRVCVMSDLWRMSKYMVMNQNVI